MERFVSLIADLKEVREGKDLSAQGRLFQASTCLKKKEDDSLELHLSGF